MYRPPDLKTGGGFHDTHGDMRLTTGTSSGMWRKEMKKRACIMVFATFAAIIAASAQTPTMDAKPAAPAAPAATAPAAASVPAATAAASHGRHATHVATTRNKGWRHWWRNRQIERGPRALRPGHHRRLLRRG
jgi:hypothetical protein